MCYQYKCMPHSHNNCFQVNPQCRRHIRFMHTWEQTISNINEHKRKAKQTTATTATATWKKTEKVKKKKKQGDVGRQRKQRQREALRRREREWEREREEFKTDLRFFFTIHSIGNQPLYRSLRFIRTSFVGFVWLRLNAHIHMGTADAIVLVLYPSLKIKICGSIFLSFGRYVFFSRLCSSLLVSVSHSTHLLRSAFVVMIYTRPACCCIWQHKHIPTHAHFFRRSPIHWSRKRKKIKKKPIQVHSHTYTCTLAPNRCDTIAIVCVSSASSKTASHQQALSLQRLVWFQFNAYISNTKKMPMHIFLLFFHV